MSDSVRMTEKKTCDIHWYDKKTPGIVAHYDAKTKMGPWANMCEACFQEVGIGLGTGLGQKFEYAPGVLDA